ncbi:hypothetical protein CN326_06275 [Bacillus sp. AFS018417]|uniref:hypothetical protein n=1 Tax=unclassified Bacillus (in: firmicutes) TaxID=185979 RepID=UPI000BF551F8|nr:MULTISPECIES: hypothetical protein [unclassified Bacillus (in: firmicutes)]MCP1123683.1 hypothetical protein [Bacillus sp. 3103sda1]PEZ08138.1 hypothetical protein CN326_06275 [Bacillus sp. AFS018417]
MRTYTFTLLIIILFCLTSCSPLSNNKEYSDVKTMKINNREVPFNQKIINIINQRETDNVKYAMVGNIEPNYTIHVKNDTYKIFDLDNEIVLVIAKIKEKDNRYTITKNNYKKLVKLINT